jgi:hypothetical protein
MTQHEMLLTLFKEGHRLTVLDSLRLAGVLALSQRVGELKREGHDIKSKLITIENRFGKKQVSVYWMEPLN